MSDSEVKNKGNKKESNQFDREEITKVVETLENSLSVCEKERQEYLDGWKRAKADALNEKKRLAEQIERYRQGTLVDFVEKILPVLDSTRAALETSSEGDTDTWRKGIENIYAQCLQSLRTIGAEVIEPVGETFDPHKHESVGEDIVTIQEKQNSITQVVLVGVVVGSSTVRAPLVRVGVYTNKKQEKK